MEYTYVISNIHGRYHELIKLLKSLKNMKKIIFLGDYICKGFDSFKVISFFIDLQKNSNFETVFLLGDFEYNFCKGNISFLKKNGGENLFYSYIKDRNINKLNYDKVVNIMNELKHYEFLSKLNLYHEDNNYIYLHSGFNQFFNNLKDVIKNDKLSIINSNMNFVKSQKLLNSKKVIFGHMAFEYPYIDDYKIGINTGMDILTAFCIEEKSFYNDKNESYTLESIIKKENKILIGKEL